MRTAVARSASQIEALRPVWEHLYSTGEHSLFQSFAWNLLAARVFAQREPPLVVHVRSGGGEAILPACIKSDGSLGMLGEMLFDYRDALSAGDNDALRHGWGVLAGEGREFSLTALHGERVSRRWQELGFAPSPFCNAPLVATADTSAAQFATQHARLASRLRRLQQAGAEFRVHSGAEPSLVRELYRRKSAQRQRDADNLFIDPLRVEFAVAAAAQPGCEVFTLESGSRLVAALLSFRDRDIRRWYTTWYDPAWARYSPGMLLLYEVARHSLAEHLDSDLMTGEQLHKSRLASRTVPLFRVEARAESLAAVARGAPAWELAA